MSRFRLSDQSLLLFAFVFSFGNYASMIASGSHYDLLGVGAGREVDLFHRLATLWCAPIWFAAQVAALILLCKILKIPHLPLGKTLFTANLGMGICLVSAILLMALFQLGAKVILMIFAFMGIFNILLIAWGLAAAFSVLYIPLTVMMSENQIAPMTRTLIFLPFIFIVVLGFPPKWKETLGLKQRESHEFVPPKSAYLPQNPNHCLKLVRAATEKCIEQFAHITDAAENCEKIKPLYKDLKIGSPERDRRQIAYDSCHARFQ